MTLKDHKKPYSEDVMEAYCKENIDKYEVEPIVREAFHRRLIYTDIAFVHLRVAQMEEGKEKLTGRQIAREVGKSPSVIIKYKRDHVHGITPKIFMRILIETHLKDMLDLWERNDFNQALADYVNKYKGMRIVNGDGSQKGDYELQYGVDISKDICRKIYRELVSERKRSKDDVDEKEDIIVTVSFVEAKEKKRAKIEWQKYDEGKVLEFEYDNDILVHELVHKMQNVIGGVLSWKGYKGKVYIQKNRNRKARLSMEYVALVNERVYLL